MHLKGPIVCSLIDNKWRFYGLLLCLFYLHFIRLGDQCVILGVIICSHDHPREIIKTLYFELSQSFPTWWRSLPLHIAEWFAWWFLFCKKRSSTIRKIVFNILRKVSVCVLEVDFFCVQERSARGLCECVSIVSSSMDVICVCVRRQILKKA